MNFAAIDVETANADMASICQIGVASYKDGILIDEWVSYVDPEDYFDGVNVSIHGIDESVVAGAPTFTQIVSRLYASLDNNVAVCHTHFDRVSLSQASSAHHLRPPNAVWLDSARVARRTWQEFAWTGYGLKNICNHLGYEFNHHNALEDAKAAAHILLAAVKESGKDLDYWLSRVQQPIDNADASIRRDGDPQGLLYGEQLVFTGALEITRHQAADLAATLGCQVTSGVTKKTTLLVVGDQDIQKLGGHEKSSKHRKAEELIAQGFQIRILRESDFKELARMANGRY